MHNNSILIFQKHILPLIQPGMRVLEVGAPWGKSAYRPLLPTGAEYFFCDARNKGAGTPGFIRMLDDCTIDVDGFDAIISGQTIEHVRWPWSWLRGLAAATIKGGYVGIICPVTWAEHRHPIDAWRILPDGMQALFDWAGLDVVHVGMESLDETSQDHRYQFNPGKVIDCIGIARKR